MESCSLCTLGSSVAVFEKKEILAIPMLNYSRAAKVLDEEKETLKKHGGLE